MGSMFTWRIFGLVVLSGCTHETTIRLGVDSSLQELGLPEILATAFEQSRKVRVEVRYLNSTTLETEAAAGALDAVLSLSDASMERLQVAGIFSESAVWGHEELVLVGPFEDQLGRHGDANGAELLKNLARSNYRYLKAKSGSPEAAMHQVLFKQGGDRVEPGSFFEANLEGAALVREVINAKAFGLVRRSSLVLVMAEGKQPHRIYKEGDPELVLRLWVGQVHPARAGRKVHASLFEFAMGEPGSALLANLGRDRLGLPAYVLGDVERGQGAKRPEISGGLKPAD